MIWPWVQPKTGFTLNQKAKSVTMTIINYAKSVTMAIINYGESLIMTR